MAATISLTCALLVLSTRHNSNAGGLIFVAATQDDYIRAFVIEIGRKLWKSRLPAGGQATPMS